jgi:hypothetical protein
MSDEGKLESTQRKQTGIALVAFAAGFFPWYLSAPFWVSLVIFFAVLIGLHMAIGIKLGWW